MKYFLYINVGKHKLRPYSQDNVKSSCETIWYLVEDRKNDVPRNKLTPHHVHLIT